MSTSSAAQCHFIIPAAGIGARMQAATAKQYMKLGDAFLLEHTLNKIIALPWVAQICVVLHPEDRLWATVSPKIRQRVQTTEGGATRADSVQKGLAFLKKCGVAEADWVLVHDAARPCVTASAMTLLKQRCLASEQGGILACALTDTIKQQQPELTVTSPQNLNEKSHDASVNNITTVITTVDRQHLFSAQTPQMFLFHQLEKALRIAKETAHALTDEASAIEALGEPYQLVCSDDARTNIKMTVPADELFITAILQQQGVLRCE